MMQKLYTLKEAAAILGLMPGTLRGWCRDKKITYVRVGWFYRFREEHLEEYLEKAVNE